MELLRALGSLIETPSEEHGAVAKALGLPPAPTPAVHGRVVAFQRRPCASIYLGADGMIGGDVRDRIAGFRRALKLDPCPEPDHLASLLALAAGLGEWRGDEVAGEDRAAALLLAQARTSSRGRRLLGRRTPRRRLPARRRDDRFVLCPRLDRRARPLPPLARST